MAKLYLINLSEQEKQIEEKEFNQRDFNVIVLKELLRAIGNKQSDFEKYFTIKETIDQIDTLDGDVLSLDKEQLTLIRKGFELSPQLNDGRGIPIRQIWDKYENGLYKQIHKPEEKDV